MGSRWGRDGRAEKQSDQGLCDWGALLTEVNVKLRVMEDTLG